MLINGMVVRSSDVQFYESRIASVAPAGSPQQLKATVPAPEPAVPELAAADNDTELGVFVQVNAGGEHVKSV